MASFIGALIGVFVLSLLVEWILKKIAPELPGLLGYPLWLVVPIGGATLASVIIASYGNADGGPPDYSFSGSYFLAGLTLWVIRGAIGLKKDGSDPEPPAPEIAIPAASPEPEAQPEPQLQKEPSSTPDPQIQQDRPPAADVTVPETSPEQVDELEPQGWISCEDCGDKVSKRLTVCPHCGCPIEPKVICPDCGENFVASLAACPACGGPAPDSSG